MKSWSPRSVRERFRNAAEARDRARLGLADGVALATSDQDVARAVSRLAEVGYVVLPGYVTGERLEQLRHEVGVAFSEHAAHAQVGQGGDQRLFGVEVAGPALAAFNQDAFLARVGNAFAGPLGTVTTMANRLRLERGGESSGGGWHRDRFDRQFKVMLYLSDVARENGPFRILPRSKRPWPTYFAHLLLGTRSSQRRWTDREMGRLLAFYRPVSLAGPAGTAILFDSSCIHQGTPLERGERLAITNYYYEPASNQKKLRKKLRPIAALTPLHIAGSETSR